MGTEKNWRRMPEKVSKVHVSMKTTWNPGFAPLTHVTETFIKEQCHIEETKIHARNLFKAVQLKAVSK